MKALRMFLGFPIWLLGLAFALLLTIGNIGAPIFSKSITLFLGFPTHKVEGGSGTVYFPSSYETPEAQYAAAATVAREIEAEGIVLLRNEDEALPLASGSHVTLLGQDSVDFVYGGTTRRDVHGTRGPHRSHDA